MSAYLSKNEYANMKLVLGLLCIGETRCKP